MGKTIKIVLIGGLLVLILAGISGYGMMQTSSVKVLVKPSPVIKQINTFSYKGEEGKDALAILKEQTTVGQDKSGLVTAIGGRKADNNKKEFWAFYVNGKMAEVGPAEYVTKDGDEIEWKIEKY